MQLQHSNLNIVHQISPANCQPSTANHQHRTIHVPVKKITEIICLAGLLFFFGCTADKEYSGWPQYKGSEEGIHYSSLSEIAKFHGERIRIGFPVRRNGSCLSIGNRGTEEKRKILIGSSREFMVDVVRPSCPTIRI